MTERSRRAPLSPAPARRRPALRRQRRRCRAAPGSGESGCGRAPSMSPEEGVVPSRPSDNHGETMATPPPGLPPRILVVMPAQWPRALVRAELRERGYDAAGARDLLEALSEDESAEG